jgi:hypothetical protein
MIFLYNFLFVVYFYSNKIWCIEKLLVLQYTIKPIDFTGVVWVLLRVQLALPNTN